MRKWLLIGSLLALLALSGARRRTITVYRPMGAAQIAAVRAYTRRYETYLRVARQELPVLHMLQDRQPVPAGRLTAARRVARAGAAAVQRAVSGHE